MQTVEGKACVKRCGSQIFEFTEGTLVCLYILPLTPSLERYRLKYDMEPLLRCSDLKEYFLFSL